MASRQNISERVSDALMERYHAPSEVQFQDEDGKPTLDFVEANDLNTMAERMIGEFSEFKHLQHNEAFTVSYLWKRDGGKIGGKATLGKCTKAAGLVSYFSESTWVIWLAANYVNDMWFNRWQIEALLYHELSHAAVQVDNEGKGKVKPTVIAHDFQGFIGEIKRYGDWMTDLHDCRNAFEQAALPL